MVDDPDDRNTDVVCGTIGFCPGISCSPVYLHVVLASTDEVRCGLCERIGVDIVDSGRILWRGSGGGEGQASVSRLARSDQRVRAMGRGFDSPGDAGQVVDSPHLAFCRSDNRS